MESGTQFGNMGISNTQCDAVNFNVGGKLD